MAKKKVLRNRNAGTKTEAEYWGMIRSGLRKATRWWKPAQIAKVAARRHYKGKNKRQKWEFKCAACGEWFMSKDVQIDHIVGAGSLKCGNDLKGFVERLTPESPKAFQILCKPCHKIKTKIEKDELRANL